MEGKETDPEIGPNSVSPEIAAGRGAYRRASRVMELLEGRAGHGIPVNCCRWAWGFGGNAKLDEIDEHFIANY